MNPVEADRWRARHRAVNVVHQALDQVIHVKYLHRDVSHLLKVRVVAAMIGDEHQFSRAIVVTLKQLLVSRPEFLLHGLFQIGGTCSAVFKRLPEVFDLLVKRWRGDLVEFLREFRVEDVMQNCLAVVGGKEQVNLPVLRAIGHKDVARVHEEQFGKPPAKRLRFAIEVLFLSFLDAFEHELEQVALILGWHLITSLFACPCLQLTTIYTKSGAAYAEKVIVAAELDVFHPRPPVDAAGISRKRATASSTTSAVPHSFILTANRMSAFSISSSTSPCRSEASVLAPSTRT